MKIRLILVTMLALGWLIPAATAGAAPSCQYNPTPRCQLECIVAYGRPCIPW
jgi:hypothetical protein